ncbi:acyltransferase family protein [Synechococcus sp. BA-132 BA5]|uniref:acyltransferase family protein n=1 Tax=Synechococcus sp. BA-132 BA5 TaxID=3110252 RepID=UPI002B2187F3|nr:acyltransferase family protein [Synechococcus sp. BA-132 BA5]MEA5417212.1 acyltransferase family protein [Synechococcus sp. BA-132 BA5]
MISGYVITSSLANHQSKSFADFLLRFYSRRLKRLIPALILFVIILSFLICLVNPEPGTMLGLGRRALFGISNIQLFKEATDYFAASTELNPFTHTWSLGVEEQFYLLFPLLVWVTGYGHLRESQGAGVHGPRRLFWIILALSVASLLAFCILYQSNQPAAYFLMPPRFWELGSGCLLFLVWRRNGRLANFIKRLPAFPILFLLIGAMFAPLDFAVASTVATVLLTGLLIACLRKDSAVYALFTKSPIVYLGKISYSLYLWHWGILAISRWTVGVSRWTIPLQLLLMLFMAIVSYHYLETPLRYAEWSPLRWKTVAFGLATPTVAAAGTLLMGHRHELVFLGKFKGSDFTYIQRDMECELLSPKPVKDWKTCLQRINDNPHIFVLGDSHSSNLVPSLKKAGEKHGFGNIRYLSNALKGRYSSYTSGNRDATQFWVNSITYQKFAASLKSGDLIVYSHGYSPDDKLAPIERHVTLLADSIRKAGARLVLVDDIPKPCSDEEFARSFVINPGRGCGIPKRTVVQRRQPLTDFLKSQVRKNVSYLDPIDTLCEGEECYPTLYGKILYADPSPHFSIKNPAPLQRLFDKHLAGLP